MTKLSKDITLSTAFFIVTAFLTSLTIYYNYYNVISIDGETVNKKWPYIEMAIQLTLLTFFIGKTMGLLKRVQLLENITDDYTKISYLVIIFWGGFNGVLILYYPGLNQLGLDFDSHSAYAFSAISIIQAIFFYLIIKQTIKEKLSFRKYILLLLLAIIIIFISPFLSGGENKYWE